jgi:hypothetical protein
MFEGKHPLKGEAHSLDKEGGEGEFLRELTWADLTARLEASRGRNEAAGQGQDAGDASFDATCARRIAAHHNGKCGVNHDGSSYGKEPEGTGLEGPEQVKDTGNGIVPVPRGSK